MPNVSLTDPINLYVKHQMESGVYTNLSEATRAAFREKMEREGAWEYFSLQARLVAATEAAERGEFRAFDPAEFEPEAFEDR